MINKRTSVFVVMFLLSFFGFWQFSQGIRSVDVLGLFASGVLAGAALAGFFTTRNKNK